MVSNLTVSDLSESAAVIAEEEYDRVFQYTRSVQILEQV